MIQTVLGKVSKEQLGYTLGHEHLVLDLSHIRKETDSILGDVFTMTNELLMAKQYGLTAVVDVSNIGMGRDVNKLAKISEATGLQVIASTGYYQDIYYTDDVRTSSAEEIAKLFIKELTVGIDNTNYLAGVIAEIGTSHKKITEDELKVFHAAAIASQETGTSIFTHCEYGTMALEQVKMLFDKGVSKDRILIGHLDLVDNVEYLKNVLDTGVSIAFDTVGKIAYVTDERRAEKLCELLESGYEDQIVLSLDITRKSHLKSNGGHGYSYMFHTFVPILINLGISETVIEKLLRDNVLRLLEWSK
jgi:phosphotriesterase-related protein